VPGKSDLLFVCFVVKSSGRQVDLPLTDIGGATYDEVAAVVSSARDGKIMLPEQWRAQNTRHRLRAWLLAWGLPIAGATLVFLLEQHFGHK